LEWKDVLWPITKSGKAIDLLIGAIVAGFGSVFTMALWGFNTSIQVDRGQSFSDAMSLGRQETGKGYVPYLILFWLCSLTMVIPILGPAIFSGMVLEAYAEKFGGLQFAALQGGMAAMPPAQHQQALPGGQMGGQPMGGYPGYPQQAPPQPGYMPQNPQPMGNPGGPPPGYMGAQPMGAPPGYGPPPGQMGPPPGQMGGYGQQPQMGAPMGPPPGYGGAPPGGMQPGQMGGGQPGWGAPPAQAGGQAPWGAQPHREDEIPTRAMDGAALAGMRAMTGPGQGPPMAAAPAPKKEEDDFYSGKTQAMELKPVIRNPNGTFTCAYCNNMIPPGSKATCPSCGNFLIGM
jgi:hypothetical protein